MRRILMVLMVFMSLSALHAAGKSEQAATEPPLIRVLTGGWYGTNYNEVQTTQILEEMFNVRIDWVGTAGHGDDLVQRQQVMMAARDYPEIMAITRAEIEVSYTSAGALLPFNQYFDQYPNLASYLAPSTWDALRYDDGNVYIIPTTSSYTDGQTVTQTRVALYRLDWLEKFGLSVPTTPEEYFTVAEAFSKRDPNESGRNDTFAIIGSQGAIDVFTHIFGAYGGFYNFWVERDGQAVNLALEPGTKEALRFAKRLWDAGLVDPEWITDSRDRGGEKRLQGVGGAIWNHGSITNTYEVGGQRDTFLRNNPDGEWVIGPPLVAPGYEAVAHGGNAQSPRGWMRTTVVKDAPNALAALQLLDYVASEEGRMLFNFGREDEHYRVRDDGSVEYFATQEEAASFGIGSFFLPIVRPQTLAATAPDFQANLQAWEPRRLTNLADVFLISEIGQFNAALTDYANETFVNMVVGEIPIDGGFERFVAEFNRRGGDALRAALNRELAGR